jgi:hypothetical protein
MPLQWTTSHPKRLVVAVAKGEMRPRAMVDFLAALDEVGARPYAKLVFLERLITTFSEESVLALANLVRKREQESEVGPIAIIAPDDATFEQACQFAHVAELVRPIRVFREWHEGRRWIDAITTDRANAAD